MKPELCLSLPRGWESKRVRVLLVGAGGTGSQWVAKLVSLHRALVAVGHPYGLHVTIADDDTVSSANVGRQAFYPSDVGRHKSVVLATRANAALSDCAWTASIERVSDRTDWADYDLVIGAVDSREGRRAIYEGLRKLRDPRRLWLDTGNRADDGQVIIGQVYSERRKPGQQPSIPCAAEFYPELIDTSRVDSDDTPSCSLAEALEKQSLFINPTMADFAGNLLWKLFREGYLTTQGVLVNLKTMTTAPLRISADTWKRFGIKRTFPKVSAVA